MNADNAENASTTSEYGSPNYGSTNLVDHLARASAITLVILTLFLLLVGSLVTTFRAGMADPVWPTEPWFLAVSDNVEWKEEKAGFLIEHSHRAVAYVVGGVACVMCLLFWLGERVFWIRALGLLTLIAVVPIYGQLQRALGTIRIEDEVLIWPREQVLLCGGCAGLLLITSAASVAWGRGARWARLLASFVLVGVMIQGMLGGLRVYLNELYGNELKQIHGVFAQIVFAMTAGVMTLSKSRRSGDALPEQDRLRLLGPSVLLVLVLIAQLIFGVIMRHSGTTVSQRLHFLTAFLATGTATWLAIRTLAAPESRLRLSFAARHLLIIVAFQVMFVLGVFGWLFTATGPQAFVEPMKRELTKHEATIRTLHVLIGASLLASATSYLIRVARRPASSEPIEPA